MNARTSRRLLLALTLLALITRLVWVLWVHPPSAYVFSDMMGYVKRATDLVEDGFVPGTRPLAWQAWGTHYFLAFVLKIVGIENLYGAGVVWGLMGAAVVPLAYLLACRVCSQRWMSAAAGVAVLLWHPNLVTTGFFTSETPALCFGVWATLRLVILLQDGKGAARTGLACALAFVLRPQLTVFFVLATVVWAFARRRGRTPARLSQIVIVGACLASVLAFSMWRFHQHTGRWGGIAEAANANNTAARCHNARTQAFRTERQMNRSRSFQDGRLIGIIPFQTKMRRVPNSSILGMRPALGTKAHGFTLEVIRDDGTVDMVPMRVGSKGYGIKFVGYIGDHEIHRTLQRLCIHRTGTLEQLRYALVNLSGLWLFNSQWPDSARNRAQFHKYSMAYIYVFNTLVWLPSMIGIGLALRRRREQPGLLLCALQLLALYAISSYFFGSIRLRTPYDPFAIILAIEAYGWMATRARPLVAKLRGTQGAATPAAPTSEPAEPKDPEGAPEATEDAPA